jgi:hypothetical protein
MLNVLQRVGGSLGTAIVAVILQHELEARPGGHGIEAFAHTYWWVLIGTALALIPAVVLAFAQRAAAREVAAPAVPSVG